MTGPDTRRTKTGWEMSSGECLAENSAAFLAQQDLVGLQFPIFVTTDLRGAASWKLEFAVRPGVVDVDR